VDTGSSKENATRQKKQHPISFGQIGKCSGGSKGPEPTMTLDSGEKMQSIDLAGFQAETLPGAPCNPA
jgi:hypothetical protein